MYGRIPTELGAHQEYEAAIERRERRDLARERFAETTERNTSMRTIDQTVYCKDDGSELVKNHADGTFYVIPATCDSETLNELAKACIAAMDNEDWARDVIEFARQHYNIPQAADPKTS